MLEILGLLADGFTIVFQLQNLLLIIGGCALGLFIGAMPGLGSVNGVLGLKRPPKQTVKM